jgi:hypothetical protein
MLAAKTVLHVDDLAADERYTNRRDPCIVPVLQKSRLRLFRHRRRDTTMNWPTA